jgi:hypothetical protein
MEKEIKTEHQVVKFISWSLLSWVILATGFLSPLTPSEGYPGILELLLFIGLPISVLIYSTVKYKNQVIMIIGIIQMVVIILLTKWLLADVLHHPYFN